MPIFLRQSTTSQEIPLGYFVDSTDGNTEETGLTIANTDIKLWKTGATTLANKNSGGGTHISNGIYYAVLDDTDTNTIGPMVVFVHVSGALAVRVECCVLDEAVYDVQFGTTAPATATNITAAAGITLADNAVAAAKIATGAITAAKFAAGAIDAAAIAANAIGASELAADAVAEIADGVWDELSADHVGAGSVGERVERLDIITSGGSGGLTNARAALLDNLDAAVSSRLAPTVAARTLDVSAGGEAGVDWANVGSPTTTVGLSGTTIKAVTDGVTLAASAVQAIWDALTSALTTVGSIGKKLADWVVGTIDTYTGNTPQTGDSFARIGATGSGLTSLAQASVATEARLSELDAGTPGKAAAEIDLIKTDAAAILVDTGTTLDGKIDVIDGIVDSILVDTAEIGAAGAGLTAITAKTNLIPEGPAKNVAFTYVIKMVQSSDHTTPATGLTITMTRSLDGAAFAAAGGTVTEISTGHYKVAAAAADMNGDVVAHRFAATGADDYTQVIQTTA